MPEPIKGGRYMAGLDGLRALAVLAVIAYHLGFGWAQGGLLGVGVFFVLSGYLITDLLASEWRRTGRIDLRAFWLRRARRLLPAMLVMLAGAAIWIALLRPSQLDVFWADAPPSLLYVGNWWFIFHKVSYFESFGPPSPLGHLWSLAVEEQFYLIGPLLFIAGLRATPNRGKLLGWTLAGAAASAIAMALLFEPGVDPSRVYYGTDTRAFSLLIGAALAIVWPSTRLSARAPRPLALTLDAVGTAGLLIVLLMIVRTSEYDPFLYRGGLVLLSVATAVVVAVVAHPAAGLGKLLGWKPLRWLGVRSYGIYLWHYPVIVLTSPYVHTGEVNLPLAVIQVGISIGLAAFSWRFIEEPIRRGFIGEMAARLRERKRQITGAKPRRLRAVAIGTLLAFTLLCVCTAKLLLTANASSQNVAAPAPPTSPPVTVTGQVYKPGDSVYATAVHSVPPTVAPTPVPDRQATNDGTEPRQSETPAPEVTPVPSAVPTDDPSAESVTGPNDDEASAVLPTTVGSGLTAIGDSVILDAAPYLEKLFPGIVIDGKIGRQLSQAQDVIDQLKSEGKLGSRVIIELGTNGSFTQKQLESLLRSIGDDRQIVLVNTRVPRNWEDMVNTALADAANTFPHTQLIDWYSASAGKDDYFYDDGVHLKPDGAEFYASLLAKTIDPEQAAKAGSTG